ncbi:MAG: SdrD B-like domain-containing protein [Gemmataceae bacterium]
MGASKRIGGSESEIKVRDGAGFLINAAGATWGTVADDLKVTNDGIVRLDAPGLATIAGNYISTARTQLERGLLQFNGSIVQSGSPAVFELRDNTTVLARDPGHLMRVEGGLLSGQGTVAGNLHIGRDPALGGTSSAATIAPGFGLSFGTITVQESLHMFGDSRMEIEVEGYGATEHDWVVVTGHAALSGTIAGYIKVPPRDPQWIKFMTADSFPSDFGGQVLSPSWDRHMMPQSYWFKPITGVVGGNVRGDANGNGVFEPGLGEAPLGGIEVRLFDAENNQLGDPVTTDSSGHYDFGEVLLGSYAVKFTRPEALRPVLPGAGTDEMLDSDYDYATLTAGVTLDDTNSSSSPYADALFRPLVAVADFYAVAAGSAVSGNVLANDPPAAGDTLTVALAPGSGPALGTLVLHADGSFTYTPPATIAAATYVYFEYVVTDSYGHTATATVTILINTRYDEGGPGDPPPP